MNEPTPHLGRALEPGELGATPDEVCPTCGTIAGSFCSDAWHLDHLPCRDSAPVAAGETPETDLEVSAWKLEDGHGGSVVFSSFARRLELQRNQARALAERETAAAVALQGRVAELERDLLQVKEDLRVSNGIGDTFWDALKLLKLEAINVMNPGGHVRQVIQERDSLRAELAALKGKQP